MPKNFAAQAFFALCLGLLAPLSLRAGTAAESDALGFKSALADNLKAGSAFLAEPFAKSFAFGVGSQSFSPVGAKGLLHFNVGLGGGIATTAIDKSGVKAAAQSNGTDLQGMAAGLPDALPLPLGTFNAHVGLPSLLFFQSLDLGLSFKNLDVKGDEISIKLGGMGLELRGNLLEAGLATPVTLTLGLGLEQLKSEIRFAKKLAATSGSYGSSSYAGNSRYVIDLDSQILLTSLKASVSRKFLFITPYAGVALNVLSGDTSLRSAQEGSLTFTDGGSNTYTLTDTIEGKGSKPAPSMDVKLAGGIELSFFFLYLALGGEYGVVSGGAGGHGQLGLQF